MRSDCCEHNSTKQCFRKLLEVECWPWEQEGPGVTVPEWSRVFMNFTLSNYSRFSMESYSNHCETVPTCLKNKQKNLFYKKELQFSNSPKQGKALEEHLWWTQFRKKCQLRFNHRMTEWLRLPIPDHYQSRHCYNTWLWIGEPYNKRFLGEVQTNQDQSPEQGTGWGEH